MVITNFYKNLLLRLLTIVFLGPVFFELLYNSNFAVYTFSFILIYFILIQREWYNMTKDREMGMIIFSIPFVSLLMIRLLDRIYPCLYFLSIWSADAFAMIGGTVLQGPKLTLISPNKTWSGVFSGMIGCFLVLYAFLPIFTCIQYSIILSLAGQVGDIYMSYYKRRSGILETGNMLPGHGGLIDRFDSTIFSAPLFWFLIQN